MLYPTAHHLQSTLSKTTLLPPDAEGTPLTYSVSINIAHATLLAKSVIKQQ
jgi:hypothetical protein